MRNHSEYTKLLISRRVNRRNSETPVLFMQPSYRPRGNLRGKTETRKPRDVNVNFLASEGKKECGGREDEEIRVLPFPIALQCNDISPPRRIKHA